jgi:hypothetical protein
MKTIENAGICYMKINSINSFATACPPSTNSREQVSKSKENSLKIGAWHRAQPEKNVQQLRRERLAVKTMRSEQLRGNENCLETTTKTR